MGQLLNRRGNDKIVLTEIIPVGKGIGLGTFGHRCPPVGVPISGKKPARQRAPRNQSNTLVKTQRDHFPLFFAVDQVVVILHGDKALPAVFLGQVQGLGKLPGGHAAGPQVTHLAALNQRIKRLQGFLNRRVKVPAVDLVQVDVVHVEPSQGILARLDNVSAAQATAVFSGPHLAPHLGRHHDIVTRGHLIQPMPGDLLAQTD